MSGLNHQVIKNLFHEVSELEPAARTPFLDQNCPNEEVRREVEELLAFHDKAADFIDQPAFVDIGLATAESDLIGRQIGNYKIESEIGRGGMGAVYLAARADAEFNQKVALKIVKRGMDTDFVLRRFRQERQILASLEHPHIARLLDGGTTDDGLPFFVMEYVDGADLLSFCEAKNLSLAERLELFRAVCAAVAYAHQHLVVHRDLKPSNILVTADGTPKLLDFGIAKLLQASDGIGAKTTGLYRLLTPEYASPEQVRGEKITTASDVYSLGVILYELLTARSPYSVKEKTAEEYVRAVCETEPPAPSRAISDLGTRSASTTSPSNKDTIASEAQTKIFPKSESRNPKSLRGDLDNIVLKSLQKDAARRYQSVQEFSEDIRRHLVGLPVLARPDTAVYRIGKFIERHKIGVLMASVTVLLVLSAASVAVWQAIAARRAEKRAEMRFNQVRKLANTVIFDYHERIKTLPGATETRKKIVADAVEYLDNLAQTSGDSIELQRELALAYRKIAQIQGGAESAGNTGETAASKENYRKAIEIQEKLVARTNADEDRQTLAKLFTETNDKLPEAIAILRELTAKNPSNTAYQNDLANAYWSLAQEVRSKGDYDVALENFRQAVAIYEKLAAAPSEKREVYLSNIALTYKNMGGVLELKKDSASASELYRQALAIDAEFAAANQNNVQAQLNLSFTYNSVASSLTNLANYAEALEYCQKALAIQEKTVSNDSKNAFAKNALARTYRRMGDILQYSGRFDEAVSYYDKAVALAEKMSQEDAGSNDLKVRLADIYAVYGLFFFKRAEKAAANTEKLTFLREAQSLQKRGLDVFLALESQNALTKAAADGLANTRQNLQKTEAEISKLN
jgi:eukaryotic-like serine/threonine-protein kinase